MQKFLDVLHMQLIIIKSERKLMQNQLNAVLLDIMKIPIWKEN